MAAVQVTAGIDEGAVWHHGNPVAEQRAMVAGTAVVDRGHHEVLELRGPDRLALLHALTTQFTEGLGAGQPVAGLVLSPQGHVEHGFRGVDDGESFWAVTEPGAGAGLAEFLRRMTFMMRVDTIDRTEDLRLLWVGAGVDVALAPEGVGRVVAWSSEVAGGRDVLWPRDAALPDGELAGVWAHDALRIEAGVPRIGVDTDHKTIPNEIGLYGTHLDKGCYRGQETVARVHNLGRPPRRLVRLLLDGSVDTLPTQGSDVLVDGRAVGVMGSSARHHEDGPIGLALVKRGLDVDAEVVVTGQDGTEIAASQEPLVDPEAGLHFRANLRG
ncbi:YgfZ/GcvT domain-containing protein [Propionibacteriaceae bacterium G1746]|uniref:CAF17-like 4Fe-4S cluster assembly/insertion protein YgfZ n=1 Tax=Aestuariimicrobium sp. G57 TaxID=3418485 RepID=UPI003C1D7056